jgi:cytidine deaminase
MKPEVQELINAARPLLRNIVLGRPDFSAATVASAIRSTSGRIYTGVCIHLSCGIGFCAEHAAAAEMIKAGETQIDTIVAVADEGILSPCGRCRELLIQIDPRNADALIVLSEDASIRLLELLPHHWLMEPNSESGPRN